MRDLLARLPESRDVAIGVLLFATVILMILPMPTPLVDALIGLNFGIAFLLLMTAVYLAAPLALSSLPGIILISTVFRLALSISTTRLILSEGDAGRIVETFGSFVVAGNIVVGLVVFFIITVVQFIVIAKGAERIAEVSARFTLDALPGKQMSIDAELRNGDIDNVEAGRRRLELERESQFFGAMDGALKFVKGDAIAGLVIILVNLVGGLSIGMLQLGLSLGEAGRKYTLLTVGDALISQIPALLVAITAAVIVTRVRGERAQNLGADIFAQISADRRAIFLAGVSLAVMAVIPGFPTGILLTLALAFGGIGVALPRLVAARAEAEVAVEAVDPPAEPDLPPAALPDPAGAQAVVEMSDALLALRTPEDWLAVMEAMRAEVAERTGLAACTLAVSAVPGLEEDRFRLAIEGVPHLWGRARPDGLYAGAIGDVLDMHDIPHRSAAGDAWEPRLEIDGAHAEAVRAAGVPHADAIDVLARDCTAALIRNFSQFVGVQETKDLLGGMEETHPFLVGECARNLPLPKVAEVFRRLLDEGVPLHNKRQILETLVEWSATETSPLALTEHCRLGLRQALCAAAADAARVITTIVVERDTEDRLRAALRETGIGTFLVLDDAVSQALIEAVRAQVDLLRPTDVRPVVVTSMDVRRHLKTFLRRASVEIEVMSFQELADDFTLVPCATLKLPAAMQRSTSRPGEGPGPDLTRETTP